MGHASFDGLLAHKHLTEFLGQYVNLRLYPVGNGNTGVAGLGLGFAK